MFLGVPFNVFGASVILRIFCQLTGYQPGDLVFNLGDTHVYKNHMEQVAKQLKRDPRPFPIMEINPNKEYKQVEDFQYEDFKLYGYFPFPGIKAEMAV